METINNDVTNIGIGVNESMVDELLNLFQKEFIRLNASERKISIQIYRSMVEGQPVATDEIASTISMTTKDVNDIIKTWPSVFYRDNLIIGYLGLSLVEFGNHCFHVNNNTLYTWCALDSLFIPQIIQQTALVQSKDPLDNDQINMIVAPKSGISNVEPESTVMSIIIPDTKKIRENVINSFCHYVHFFGSIKNAEKWISNNTKRDEMHILSLRDAYTLGLKFNNLQYGDMLELDKLSNISD